MRDILPLTGWGQEIVCFVRTEHSLTIRTSLSHCYNISNLKKISFSPLLVNTCLTTERPYAFPTWIFTVVLQSPHNLVQKCYTVQLQYKRVEESPLFSGVLQVHI